MSCGSELHSPAGGLGKKLFLCIQCGQWGEMEYEHFEKMGKNPLLYPDVMFDSHCQHCSALLAYGRGGKHKDVWTIPLTNEIGLVSS